MANGTILVVEDDRAIRRGIVDAARFAGYEVLESDRGDRAIDLALESSIDLVVLDLMLPGKDGFEVLAELRRTKATLPIIIVTARGAESDRVRGLDEGADDYIVKPFSARELLARVGAVLRRSPERIGDIHRLARGEVEVDLARRMATKEDVQRRLSERDVEILRYLAVSRGRAVDREELLHRVWGLNPRGIQTRTVDMQVARLRAKVFDDGEEPAFILTVWNKGYMLGEDVTTESR